jgi:hypothetical protein
MMSVQMCFGQAYDVGLNGLHLVAKICEAATATLQIEAIGAAKVDSSDGVWCILPKEIANWVVGAECG